MTEAPSLSTGRAFWTVNSVPRTLTPMWMSKCSSVMSSSGTNSAMEAFANSTSSPLPRARIASYSRSRSSRFEMSPSTAVAAVAPIASTAASSSALRRPVMNT